MLWPVTPRLRQQEAHTPRLLFRKHIPHAKCEPNLPIIGPHRVGIGLMQYLLIGVSDEMFGYFDSYLYSSTRLEGYRPVQGSTWRACLLRGSVRASVRYAFAVCQEIWLYRRDALAAIPLK